MVKEGPDLMSRLRVGQKHFPHHLDADKAGTSWVGDMRGGQSRNSYLLGRQI